MTETISKNLVFPEIQEIFPQEFPQDFGFRTEGWNFSREEMGETLDDGTYKLLTLDISISEDRFTSLVNSDLENVPTEERAKVLTGRALTHYDCANACGHCFEQQTITENPLMTTEEVFAMILEAKKLGLRSVKFLGPGELIHNPRLFEILDFLRDNNIKIGIFTKGLALGDDEVAQRFFGVDATELCKRLAGYENVYVIMGMTSADEKTENRMICSRNVPNFFAVRNKAFENLTYAGLNNDQKNQRLVIACAPVLRTNIDEVFTIYKWALKRNIPVMVAPTMVSGKGKNLPEVRDPKFKEELVELFIQIYTWLIKEEVLDLADISREGISPYGGMACNQFVCGMFVRKDGRVQGCPGNEDPGYVYAKDVRGSDLKTIWKESLAYKLRRDLAAQGRLTTTQPCYAKSEGITTPDGVLVKEGEGSIPRGFYEAVIQGVRRAILDQKD